MSLVLRLSALRRADVGALQVLSLVRGDHGLRPATPTAAARTPSEEPSRAEAEQIEAICRRYGIGG